MGRKKGSKNKQIKAVPTQLDRAEVPEEMSREIIRNYHSHLANAKIAYLYKNKPIKNNGREAIATAKKASLESNALCNYTNPDNEFHFIIMICYEAWNNLTDKQKSAVLDHELSHCLVDEDESTGDTIYKLIPHDFEDFYSTLDRHGLYMSDLEHLKNVVKK